MKNSYFGAKILVSNMYINKSELNLYVVESENICRVEKKVGFDTAENGPSKVSDFRATSLFD